MTARNDDTETFARFALALAEAGGQVARRYFRTGLAAEKKSDASPVTLADREAERAMRLMIRERFKDHGILGEEHGAEGLDREYVWVLDPIDGTVSFVLGAPIFGTIVALLKREESPPAGLPEGMPHGKPIVGVIHMPMPGATVVGAGGITRLDGRPVKVRECTRLGEASMLGGDPRALRRRYGTGYDSLVDGVGVYRGFSDCVGPFLLASGTCDVVIDGPMKPWDILPLIPVVEGAGGRITDDAGNDARMSPFVVATAGGHVHEEVLAHIRNKAR